MGSQINNEEHSSKIWIARIMTLSSVTGLGIIVEVILIVLFWTDIIGSDIFFGFFFLTIEVAVAISIPIIF